MDVAEFYERYPYPRPMADLDDYRGRWQAPERRRAEYHLTWPHRPFHETRSILVAGCGTSQAAKHALRWPEATLVGIDVSATSVRCTQALKERHALDNLQVHQLPIERVEELGIAFDEILCTGVLQLMVYAPYGRAGIYLMQAFCKRLGIQSTDADIRRLITALTLLPKGHPLESLLRQAPDFREEAALADALLNPQDRAYSVPQFYDFIEGAGLSFGRWIRQAPYSPECGAVAHIPQIDALRALPPPEQYAAVELFRGTMLRHSAIVYRDDNPDPPSLNFDGEAWRNYVPMRLPDTLCLQEQLPVGASAVLLNRSHPYPDIVLPIDAREKSLFDEIDGRRTIAQIADARGDARTARGFFERLWWHDQVVFDASR